MEPPSGRITLLFTDIEGSTKLWEACPDSMRQALEQHDGLVRRAIEEQKGYVFKTVGDAFCAAFADPEDALSAAIFVQRALGLAEWPDPVRIRARMGLHTGTCYERDGDYFGPVVNRVARLEAAAHGGQIVLSDATARLIDPAGIPGVELIDLGVHRLKDLGAPERIFSVTADGLQNEFPPLRSLDSSALLNNLPEQLSEFVGREHELKETRQLLMEERLLTLTGPGGAGKTRLALQLAADLLDGSGDGVWLIELASVTEPDLVPAKVASVLNVQLETGREAEDVVVEALSRQDILLVLDNCEHVIGACAKLAYSLLRSGPRVHILATSREPLGVEGERIYRVPSLRLPTNEEQSVADLLDYDAIRLFVDRASRHQPGFSLNDSTADDVLALCRQLDGMPLAIELAAARIRTMSVAQVRTRLAERFRLLVGTSRTAPARHQTLRATVDWSYALLNDAEQEVLRFVSVFVGGFDLDAAQACLMDTIGPWEVDDLLAALVDRSLIQSDTTEGSVRLSMLETIREYAAERLGDEGADRLQAAHRKHADYFVGLAEELGAGLRGPDQISLRARVAMEDANFRAAINFLLSGSGDPVGVLRLASALRPYWQARSDLEIGGLICAALTQPEASARDPLRAQSLCAAGSLITRHDPTQGRALLEEGLEIATEIQADRVVADCLRELSYTAMSVGDIDTAFPQVQRSLEISTRIGDKSLVGYGLDLRATCSRYRGDLSSAKDDHTRAIAIFREIGDIFGVAAALVNLAMVELADSDTAAARRNLEEAEKTAVDLGFTRMELYVRLNLGTAALLECDLRSAETYWSSVLVDARRFGEVEAVGYGILGLALCATATNDHYWAAALHGAADAVLASKGFALDTLEATLRDDSTAKLRTELVDRYDEAYGEGRRLDVQSAIGLALDRPTHD